MKLAMKFFTSICLAVILLFTLGGQAFAVKSSDVGIKVVKNQSFTEKGLFYMSFTLTGASNTPTMVSAFVKNAGGQTALRWKDYELWTGKTEKRNFPGNYSKLPTGKYTFVLQMKTVWSPNYTFQWKYDINHKQTISALTFKGYEKMLAKNGLELHKFTINSIGSNGKRVVLRIFDSKGNLVWLQEGPVLKHDNSNTWFKWNGWSDIGGGYKCSSGKYTVQAYFQGGEKIVEKVYDLKIF